MPHRRRSWWAYLAAGSAICIAALAYGYVRATSRAYVNVIVARAEAAPGVSGVRAELILRDAAGNVLAQGETDDRFGFARFVHPTLGSCEEEEKAAAVSVEGRSRWQVCNTRKFEWQAQWSGRVSMMDVRFNACHLTSVPLQLSRRRDEWWLWWVPLPHIGGDPLTEFSAKLRVSENPCRVQAVGIYE
jgi:hypothetical protein